MQLDQNMGLLFLTGDFTAFTGADSVDMYDDDDDNSGSGDDDEAATTE